MPKHFFQGPEPMCDRAMKTRSLPCFFLILSLFIFVGCSKIDEKGRSNITGLVRFNGDLLSEGDILFAPIDTKAPPEAGIIGGNTTITNGKYSLNRDLGLFEGTYSVRISSLKLLDPKTGLPPSPEKLEANPDAFFHENLIPKKYNDQSELTIHVVGEKNQTFDFDLESKAAKTIR